MYLLNVAVIEPHDLINCGSELVQAVIFKQIIKIERIKDCRISSIVNHIKKSASMGPNCSRSNQWMHISALTPVY